MYDWANSVYSLVITSTIFPIYFLNIARDNGDASVYIDFFIWSVNDNALFAWSLAFAFLLAAVLAPLLSGIADYSGRKKFFMKVFCYLGGISCCSLFFFQDISTIEFGIIASALAGVGFTGSIVFYNAYLPEIAPPGEHDRVSAKGFSLGYMGSVILLLINLALIMSPETFGLEGAGIASRISFLMVGIWWIGFAQITFARLPKETGSFNFGKNAWSHGYREITKVFGEVKQNRTLKYYLLGFFFFSAGIQTVMYMAPTFAKTEILDMKDELLIVMTLIIQLVAIGGAYLFSYLSSRLGNIKGLLIALVTWILIISAVYFIYYVNPFLVIAFFVGLIMGGSQSLARSTYSKLMPQTKDSASYFSFYDLVEKFSIVFGLAIFAIINQNLGSARYAVIAILILFIIGLIILRILAKKGDRDMLDKLRPLK